MTVTVAHLLSDLRQHDAAMDKAPWYSAESRWQSDCVLTGAPDADMTNDGRVVVQANPNFPYRENLDAIAWFGTHRGELLALVERLQKIADAAWAFREEQGQCIGDDFASGGFQDLSDALDGLERLTRGGHQ